MKCANNHVLTKYFADCMMNTMLYYVQLVHFIQSAVLAAIGIWWDAHSTRPSTNSMLDWISWPYVCEPCASNKLLNYYQLLHITIAIAYQPWITVICIKCVYFLKLSDTSLSNVRHALMPDTRRDLFLNQTLQRLEGVSSVDQDTAVIMIQTGVRYVLKFFFELYQYLCVYIFSLQYFIVSMNT